VLFPNSLVKYHRDVWLPKSCMTDVQLLLTNVTFRRVFKFSTLSGAKFPMDGKWLEGRKERVGSVGLAWPIKCRQESKTIKSNCQFYKNSTFDLPRKNPC
jgi:hypothetical protein